MEELLFRDTGSHVFGLNFLTFECPSLAQAEQIKYREPAWHIKTTAIKKIILIFAGL